MSIYSAKELNNLKGDIVKLALKKANNVAYTNPNGQLKIYLKHTSLTSVPTYSTAYANELTGAVLVYQNSLIYNIIGTTSNIISYRRERQ